MPSDLQISELRYRRLFETAQDGILLIDFKTGIILDVNKFLIDMLGYSKKNLLKKYLWEIGVFKDVAASKKNFKILQKKRFVRFEDLPLETKAGKKIDVEFVANAYSVGSEIFIQCNIRDISDRVIAEKSLKNSEILFRELFENMSSGVVVYEVRNNGKDFIIKNFNKASEKIEKIKREGIIGKNIVNVFPGVKQFGLYKVFQRVWKTGKPENFPISLYQDKRISGWRENYVYKIPNGDIVAIYNDVTKNKEAEEKILELKERSEAIIQSIGDGLFVVDLDGKIVLINRAFESLLGWKASEVYGKKFVDLIPAVDSQGKIFKPEERPISIGIAKGKEIVGNFYNYYLVKKDKTKIPIFYHVSPVSIKGKIIGAVAVFVDITSRLELDKAKIEFVSVASHELRAPLSIMKSLISMIFEGDYGLLDKKLEEPLIQIKNSTDRLIFLVNDILNVSRIEAGKLSFNIARFNIKDLIVNRINVFSSTINKNVILKSGKLFNGFVSADREKVIMILNNLISNAIKFTHQGEIIISLKSVDGYIYISISDTGIGISPYNQKYIFEKFQQISLREFDKPSGSGLGLYISKALVQKMGGSIWLESSTVGKGSTFIFSLPKAKKIVSEK